MGFIYHSLNTNGPYTQIYRQIIRALGNALTGARYAFRDDAAAQGQTNYYQIEEVEYDGRGTCYGPISIRG